VPLGGSHDSK